MPTPGTPQTYISGKISELRSLMAEHKTRPIRILVIGSSSHVWSLLPGDYLWHLHRHLAEYAGNWAGLPLNIGYAVNSNPPGGKTSSAAPRLTDSFNRNLMGIRFSNSTLADWQDVDDGAFRIVTDKDGTVAEAVVGPLDFTGLTWAQIRAAMTAAISAAVDGTVLSNIDLIDFDETDRGLMIRSQTSGLYILEIKPLEGEDSGTDLTDGFLDITDQGAITQFWNNSTICFGLVRADGADTNWAPIGFGVGVEVGYDGDAGQLRADVVAAPAGDFNIGREIGEKPFEGLENCRLEVLAHKSANPAGVDIRYRVQSSVATVPNTWWNPALITRVPMFTAAELMGNPWEVVSKTTEPLATTADDAFVTSIHGSPTYRPIQILGTRFLNADNPAGFLIDSIAEGGTTAHSWPLTTASAEQAQLRTERLAALSAYQPDIIMFMFGLNDSYYSERTGEQFKATMAAFIDEARAVVPNVFAICNVPRPAMGHLYSRKYGDGAAWDLLASYPAAMAELAAETPRCVMFNQFQMAVDSGIWMEEFHAPILWAAADWSGGSSGVGHPSALAHRIVAGWDAQMFVAVAEGAMMSGGGQALAGSRLRVRL
ncbi:MAG: SGNH/GDSL hydrolase family protein [Phycisphaeraceae bacterium]|nr:SGNH/GDSL hydrolase family protein [Phycisphaeraceae bacterium]